MTLPTDALFANQWYLRTTDVVWGADQSVWDDYTGRGIHIGIYDNGVEETHADLDANYDSSMNVGNHAGLVMDHGTAVAGIIAAERNDTGTADGIVGIAYDAWISSVPIWGTATVATDAARADAANHTRDFDVVNHSWGSSGFLVGQNSTNYLAVANGLADGAMMGRNFLGTIITSAASNMRADGQGWDGIHSDANAVGPATESRFSIVVAGVGDNNSIADYSTPGANVLVSAGAQSGWTSGNGIWTTDLTGTAGWNTNTGGNHVSTVGTSFAAPQVAGIAALMLDANDDLGWRDVRDILAMTARHTGSAIHMPGAPGQMNGAELDIWRINHAGNWNGGGMHFSNDYGFGVVDARAAVRLAETWENQHTSWNESHLQRGATFLGGGNPALAIVDNNTTGTSFTITMPAGVDIETVSLRLGIHHNWPSDLEIFLTSPSGTQSRLLDNSGGGATRDLNGWTFVSNAFRGEDSAGTWTVMVRDIDPGIAGTIDDATLDIYGAGATDNDLYVYTDEFASNPRIAIEGARGTLTDTAGIDTINAAAVTGTVSLLLGPGSVSSINGRQLVIDGTIENAFGGDNHDSLVGNAAANRLNGGRGEDLVAGDAGDDWLDGGRGEFFDSIAGGTGNDVMKGGAGDDFLQGNEDHDKGFGEAGDDTVRGDAGNDRLTGGFAVESDSRGDDGDDRIFAGEGNDVVLASYGHDTIDGEAGIDTLSFEWVSAAVVADLTVGSTSFFESGGWSDPDGFGGGGWNMPVTLDFTGIENLVGGAGGDRLSGDEGANVLDGRAGNDILEGRGGNDSFLASAGADRFDGGTGSDRVSFANASSINVFLDGTGTNAKAAFGDTFVGIEMIIGTGAGDLVVGDGAANRFIGGGGNDNLWGRAGNDQLEGGAGADRMAGGLGNDVLIGGADADRFVFADAPAAGGIDRTGDFVHLVDDIEIDASAFRGGLVAGGAVQLVANANPTAAGFAGGVFLYDTDSGFLSFDADGQGAGAAVTFFRLQNLPTLTAADFIVVA